MAFKFFILSLMVVYCGFYLWNTPVWAQEGMQPWRPFLPELKALPSLEAPPQPWAYIPELGPGRWSKFDQQTDLPDRHLPPVNPQAWLLFSNLKNPAEQSYRPVPLLPPERFSTFFSQGDMPELTFQSLPSEKPWRWRAFASFAPMR